MCTCLDPELSLAVKLKIWAQAKPSLDFNFVSEPSQPSAAWASWLKPAWAWASLLQSGSWSHDLNVSLVGVGEITGFLLSKVLPYGWETASLADYSSRLPHLWSPMEVFPNSISPLLQADLFGAGTDTSLNTVTWALLFLSSQEFSHVQTAIQVLSGQ